MKPLIVVNFKAYREATGSRGLRLAKACETAAKRTGAKMMVAVQDADLYKLSHSVSIPVLAQHADPVDFGAHTGSALPEDLKENGAWGVLVNHSEDRVPLAGIMDVLAKCRKAGLKTMVCAESLKKAKEIAVMGPDYLAFEVPELIGTLKSVSQLAPGSLRKFSGIVERHNRNAVRKTVPLCGAGVANGADVKKALELGARGVLVATAIVKARHPEKIIKEMASA